MKFSAVTLLATAASAAVIGQRDAIDDTALDMKAIYSASKCQSACTFLSAILWGKVARPESDAYATGQARVWAGQSSDNSPYCIVTPTNALDVSVSLLMLRAVQCPFSTRSGGHTPFKGGNNIQDGIAIDLRSLNKIEIAADKKSVNIGPGNKWGQVFPVTDAAGLHVVAGRDFNVGVGGLMVGGGMSYISGRYGFASDNVISYTVVFADGTIRQVTQKSYPDVYKALRAGGNNFGIVTNFELNAYPGGNFWGGNRRHTTTAGQVPALIDALSAYDNAHETDPDASVILSYIYASKFGMFLTQTNLMHAAAKPFPAIFKNFTDITTGMISDSLREDTLTAFATELGASTASGFRQSMWTMTVKNDPEMLKQFATIFETIVAPVKAIQGNVLALSYQVMSTAITSKFTKNGGSPIGVSSSDGNLVLMNWAFQWDLSTDDETMMAAARSMYDQFVTLSKAKSAHHPFIYLNYAPVELDVFGSYGAANKAEMVATHEKWDRNGVWTKLQPGGFKIAA